MKGALYVKKLNLIKGNSIARPELLVKINEIISVLSIIFLRSHYAADMKREAKIPYNYHLQ